jgi:pyruvate,water dikinase
MRTEALSSGIPSLDNIIQEVMPGDNIVWLVSSPEQYDYFAARFVEHCTREDIGLTYVHFDARIDYSKLPHTVGVEVVPLDPSDGPGPAADALAEQVCARGSGGYYLFDNLSVLSRAWPNDEDLVTFFRSICPLLFELRAVACFALAMGGQSNDAVAKIRDTTQILLEVYEESGRVFLQPVKVWDRYSQTMFQLHVLEGEQFVPVPRNGTLRRPGPVAETDLLAVSRAAPAAAESPSIREELIRSIVSSRPEYIRIARDYFSVEDLVEIKSRTIGSGAIGGKAAGMLLSNRILRAVCHTQGRDDLRAQVREPDSFFLGADVYFNFLLNNNLMHWLDLKHVDPAEARARFPELRRQFLAGRLPHTIRERLTDVIDAFRASPVIVRSSSLLEDSFNMAFAGKYDSIFLGNQGPDEECLQHLANAVKLVYASSLSADALSYRKRQGLLEFQERMAALIQQVEGFPHAGLHFPPVAGVAFSRNPYPWSERIDARAGLVRLVLGLGTRAVNRVEADYPRLIALSHPGIHPDGDYATSLQYHQRHMDAIELDSNELRTFFIRDLDLGTHPRAFFVFSVFRDGFVRPPMSRRLSPADGTLTVTFANLLEKTNFVELMRYVLSSIETSYRYPVDIEFTLDVDEQDRAILCLLQCRPLTQRTEFRPAHIPADVPQDRVLFVARKAVPNGELHNLRYIVLIDSRSYDAIATNAGRARLARAVGAVNNQPDVADAGFALIGPGRWGSVAIELGVPVTYAEINNASLLMEMARPRDGYTPEVSYGTHFFQDLVESGIFYLPVYPEDPTAHYNEAFFEAAENSLTRLVPDCADVAPYLKLIDVPACTGGCFLHVAMNQEESLGMGYVAPRVEQE